MSLLFSRLLSSVILFAATLVAGTLPVLWYRSWVRRKHQSGGNNNISQSGSSFSTDKDNDHCSVQQSSICTLSDNRYVQFVTQLGGGILFFTVLVHMIPEVRNNFEIYLKSNHSIFVDSDNCTDIEDKPKSIEDLELPYLEIVICCGFFAIYLAEVLMHRLVGHRIDSEKQYLLDDKPMNDVKQSKTDHNINNNNIKIVDEFEGNVTDHCDKVDCDERSAILANEHRNNKTGCRSQHRGLVTASDNTNGDNDCDVVIVIEHRHPESDDPHINDPFWVRFLHGLLVVTTFSIHSIFDGISIGVRTDISEMWTVFIAIASHKLIISLIIGVELYDKCQTFALLVFHMICFAIMSPIGIFVVILAEQSLDTHSETNLLVIVLSALAAGSVLYIVFFEILQKHRVNRLTPVLQFMAMTVGFGFMLAITSLFHEHHEH